jgi:hypothetical protein
MDMLGSDLDTCSFLFLSEINELEFNGLQLVVSEGVPTGIAEQVQVGEVALPGGTRIAIAASSRHFELVWKQYIAYSVLNESYASVGQEQYIGDRFRVFSQSHFLDYFAAASFASDNHLGRTTHYGVHCEDHIVNVISTDPPSIRLIDSTSQGRTALCR